MKVVIALCVVALLQFAVAKPMGGVAMGHTSVSSHAMYPHFGYGYGLMGYPGMGMIGHISHHSHIGHHGGYGGFGMKGLGMGGYFPMGVGIGYI